MNGAWSSARCASGTYSRSVALVDEHAVALAERAAPGVLAGEAHRRALEHERAERQRLGRAPSRSRRGRTSARRASSWRSSFGLHGRSPRATCVSPSTTRSSTSRPAPRSATGRRRASLVDVATPEAGASSSASARGRRASPRTPRRAGHWKSASTRLLVVGGDVAALHELLRVELAHRRVRVDELVHARLRERGLVGLVVAVAPVADEVDDDVLLELLPELEREAHHPHRGFGVVAVHVEDRRLHHLGDVGRVHARPAELGRGGEPELVVDDDVHGAADLVAGHLGEVERLGDHALARERGVAVHEHRQHGAPGVVGGGVADRRAPCPRRPGRPPRGGWGWRRA